jgi:hypothetical protein
VEKWAVFFKWMVLFQQLSTQETQKCWYKDL